ncbi:MAG: cyclic-di-AMP receptor [Actinobacteria bacterium]|nr:cyclic-di-AMP receptor [Actinomycetota bacterium]
MALEATVDKLIVAIVQNDDANGVQSALVDAEFRVTRINTAGGFLRRGNVTLLVGVPSADVDNVIALIRGNVLARVAENDQKTQVSTMLFVLPVSKFARI